MKELRSSEIVGITDKVPEAVLEVIKKIISNDVFWVLAGATSMVALILALLSSSSELDTGNLSNTTYGPQNKTEQIVELVEP